MNRWTYFESTLVVDWVGRQVLRYCGLDPICGGRVAGGSDPEKTVEYMMSQIASGTYQCLSKLPSAMVPANKDWRTVFQLLLTSFIQPDRNILALIPALVYRIQRCSPSDVKVIYHLWNLTRQSLGNQDPSRIQSDPCDLSNVILYNAFFQEGIQHTPPISFQDMVSRSKTQLFSVNMTAFQHNRQIYDIWPLYPPDQYYHKIPVTTKPVLLVNGDLDGSTPYNNGLYANQWYQTLNPSNPPTYVHLPTCPHVGFLDSPTPSGLPCGMDIILQFMTGGGQTKLDLSCIQQIIPMDWEVTSAAVQQNSAIYFGTSDAWEWSVTER